MTILPDDVFVIMLYAAAVIGAGALIQVIFEAYAEGLRNKRRKKSQDLKRTPCAFSGCRCHKRDNGPVCEECATRKAVIEEIELYRAACIAEAKKLAEKVYSEALKK